MVFLDKMPYGEVDDQMKMEMMRSEYQPENGIVRRNLNHTVRVVRVVSSVMSGWNHEEAFEMRPSTAAPPVTHISIGRRPTTTSSLPKPKHDVSVGSPVCGNIITKARKPKNKLKTAWGDSCSSSSSFSSSDSSAQGTPVNKPNTVVGESESCEELLESARLWREKSKESRDKFNK